MSEFFKIDQVSSGWFEGVVTDKSKSIYFSASYLTDFPNDLMNAMLYALGRIPKDGDGKDSFKIEYEPAVGKWNISIDNDNFIITEKIYDDDNFKKETVSTTVIVPKDFFLHDFLMEMKKIINMFGLIGYRTEWGYEFPLSLYMQLWDVFRKNKDLIIKEKVVDGPENLGVNYEMTDFVRECEIILSLKE